MTYRRDTITLAQLAKTIDHSLLRPDMTEQEVRDGCALAREFHVASVCVKPCDVTLAVTALQNSDVLVGTVVGFPHGSAKTAVKVFETQQAIADGAREIDMVMNIGHFKSGQFEEVEADIRAVVEASVPHAIVKVILENAYLTKDEIVKACQLVESAGGHFVKTSTGYAPSGATVEDLRLMRATVSEQVHVKAAAGIRTLDALLDVIDAGAVRVGATATRTMLEAFAAGGQDSAPPSNASY